MGVKEYILEIAQRAKAASRELSYASTKVKNDALLAMAEGIGAQVRKIKTENARDLSAGKERGLSDAMLDRLELNDRRINAMAQGLREIAVLPDPVGSIENMVRRPTGIQVGKMRVPPSTQTRRWACMPR